MKRRDPAQMRLSVLGKPGIHYVYADAEHPNTIVPSAVPYAAEGQVEVYRLP